MRAGRSSRGGREILIGFEAIPYNPIRPTVEINPGVSEVSDLVDVKLNMRAAPALDAIWQAYRQRLPS